MNKSGKHVVSLGAEIGGRRRKTQVTLKIGITKTNIYCANGGHVSNSQYSIAQGSWTTVGTFKAANIAGFKDASKMPEFTWQIQITLVDSGTFAMRVNNPDKPRSNGCSSRNPRDFQLNLSFDRCYTTCNLLKELFNGMCEFYSDCARRGKSERVAACCGVKTNAFLGEYAEQVTLCPASEMKTWKSYGSDTNFRRRNTGTCVKRV